jgi:hypothetical protein
MSEAGKPGNIYESRREEKSLEWPFPPKITQQVSHY